MQLELLKLSTETPMVKGVVNVATVPHRSPFRYPGGKTWLVPFIRHWVTQMARRAGGFL